MALHSTGKSRLFSFRRFRGFGVCNRMLQMFYQSVVASALFFGINCWGGNNRASDTHKLNSLVKRAGRIVDAPQEGVEEVAKVRRAKKMEAIMSNSSHPLHPVIDGHWSKRGNDRFVLPGRRCERLGRSFVPVALKDYNDSHNGGLRR